MAACRYEENMFAFQKKCPILCYLTVSLLEGSFTHLLSQEKIKQRSPRYVRRWARSPAAIEGHKLSWKGDEDKQYPATVIVVGRSSLKVHRMHGTRKTSRGVKRAELKGSR